VPSPSGSRCKLACTFGDQATEHPAGRQPLGGEAHPNPGHHKADAAHGLGNQGVDDRDQRQIRQGRRRPQLHRQVGRRHVLFDLHLDGAPRSVGPRRQAPTTTRDLRPSHPDPDRQVRQHPRRQRQAKVDPLHAADPRLRAKIDLNGRTDDVGLTAQADRVITKFTTTGGARRHAGAVPRTGDAVTRIPCVWGRVRARDHVRRGRAVELERRVTLLEPRVDLEPRVPAPIQRAQVSAPIDPRTRVQGHRPTRVLSAPADLADTRHQHDPKEPDSLSHTPSSPHPTQNI
jgi:hypothetical protein